MKRDGDVLRAPGIGDDCRGLAMMMGVIQALNEAKAQTPGTITFAADTGEEGLGDLGGTIELFNVTLKGQIDKFISVDGTGLGITSVGVGSCRYRATFEFKLGADVSLFEASGLGGTDRWRHWRRTPTISGHKCLGGYPS